ncbi:serine protease [Oceaniglobus ichthyenteri]|uniref:serine protease n=1 Tax=Oceaniglobus ichthyenteri TaxID=2136177 RepID=UPI0013DD8A22|nr:serine protease [Oceaniglobus ichthyenteri]
MPISKQDIFTGFVVATLFAATATAQETSAVGPTDTAARSPFAFAESEAKAKARAAAEKAAESSGGRVIGGEIAAEGAWPWQVGLLIGGRPVAPDSQFCGGTIILDEWVLTAAHCVFFPDENGNGRAISPDRFNILVGTNTLQDGTGDLVPVEAVYKHPDYALDDFNHDIALVKLARKPNAAYRTIQVPNAQLGEVLDRPGVPTIVTGWGLINGQTSPAEMRQGSIQMLPREQCNGAVMEARANAASKGFSEAASIFDLKQDDAQAAWEALIDRAPLPLSENMLCSGTYEGGRTSCSGDSGGPLVVPLDDGSYVQAGVVSWGLSGEAGNGCNEQALFSAYTKVANYLPWLEQTIAQN